MTASVQSLDPGTGRFAFPRRPIGETAEHLAMTALLAFWAIPATSAFGGRGVHTELVFAALLITVMALVRVWRTPWRSAALSAAVALAALLVCVWAPTGWYGSDAATGYGLSAASYLVARRYLRDPNRRALILAAICLADLYQFSKAFEPWWGGGDPSEEMSGTFYGHNAFAAFVLPGAILGLGLIAHSRRPLSLIGWVTTPLCVAGVVYSSSRATLAALIVGGVLMLMLSVRSRPAAARVGIAIGFSAAVTFAMTGPPLFSHHVSPLSATHERVATGQSLSENGFYRTEFWRGAGEVLLHHPATGGGYHSLAQASALYTPSSWARSPNAHDGYLQALADGGFLLGLPILAAVAIAGLWALRWFWEALRRWSAREPPDYLVLAAAVALLAGLAHSAVDADWTYPSIMIEAALLVACLAPATPKAIGTTGAPSHAARWCSPIVAAVIAGVLGIELFALHQWQIQGSGQFQAPAVLLAHGEATFGDYRPVDRLLRQVADGKVVLSRAQTARALALSSRAATIDIHLGLRRDAVGALAGLMPDAVRRAEDTLREVEGGVTPYLLDFATVQVSAGDLAGARKTLADDIANQARSGSATPNAFGELVLWAREFGTAGDFACQVDMLRDLVGAPPIQALPKPTARCAAS